MSPTMTKLHATTHLVLLLFQDKVLMAQEFGSLTLDSMAFPQPYAHHSASPPQSHPELSHPVDTVNISLAVAPNDTTTSPLPHVASAAAPVVSHSSDPKIHRLNCLGKTIINSKLLLAYTIIMILHADDGVSFMNDTTLDWLDKYYVCQDAQIPFQFKEAVIRQLWEAGNAWFKNRHLIYYMKVRNKKLSKAPQPVASFQDLGSGEHILFGQIPLETRATLCWLFQANTGEANLPFWARKHKIEVDTIKNYFKYLSGVQCIAFPNISRKDQNILQNLLKERPYGDHQMFCVWAQRTAVSIDDVEAYVFHLCDTTHKFPQFIQHLDNTANYTDLNIPTPISTSVKLKPDLELSSISSAPIFAFAAFTTPTTTEQAHVTNTPGPSPNIGDQDCKIVKKEKSPSPTIPFRFFHHPLVVSTPNEDGSSTHMNKGLTPIARYIGPLSAQVEEQSHNSIKYGIDTSLPSSGSAAGTKLSNPATIRRGQDNNKGRRLVGTGTTIGAKLVDNALDASTASAGNSISAVTEFDAAQTCAPVIDERATQETSSGRPQGSSEETHALETLRNATGGISNVTEAIDLGRRTLLYVARTRSGSADRKWTPEVEEDVKNDTMSSDMEIDELEDDEDMTLRYPADTSADNPHNTSSTPACQAAPAPMGYPELLEWVKANEGPLDALIEIGQKVAKPMPPPPTSSTPGRARPDSMKDSILKESTAGWANTITPLRIAKRDHVVCGVSSSSSPNPPPKVVARRSSNSYKHMFNNNLVSRSPFRSQIPAPARISPRQPGLSNSNGTTGLPRTARKVSGEKRPRPDSLVQQAERENSLRVNELGFKRRQSKGFQGLAEKEPVSKSPFRRIMSPNGKGDDHDADDEMNMPISIELPMKYAHSANDDETSPETTETDFSLNSKENVYVPPLTIKAVDPPTRPLTPLTPPQRPAEQRFTPSPSFERRSPIPSAMQASPARSSLVQKPRVMGPRSRSLSIGGSPVDTPTRERRKTVTFDERCDVVEFDRASHEDAVFESDDDQVYGVPEPAQNAQPDSSAESSNASAEYASAEYATPKHSPRRAMPVFDALDVSINGLVDSMLQEASTFSGEPSTPELNSTSFTTIAADLNAMSVGAEDGEPHGQTHHVERARDHQHELDTQQDAQPPIPGVFATKKDDTEHDDLRDYEPSFSPISLSTPPRQPHTLPQTPQTHAAPLTYGRTPLPALPPDTERAEDGMPLGRTHHAERARTARDADLESDVKILPPSPSPMKKPGAVDVERDLPEPYIPKLDLHLNNSRTSSSQDDDVFGTPNEPRDILAELEFEHLDLDADVLSNTSIASFHEFPPLPSFEYSPGRYGREGGESGNERRRERRESDRDRSERSVDVSFGGLSNRSLDASVASIVNDLKTNLDHEMQGKMSGEERKMTEISDSNAAEVDVENIEARNWNQGFQHAQIPHADYVSRNASPVQNGVDRNSDLSPSQTKSHTELYNLSEGLTGQASLTRSDAALNRSPRVGKEGMIRRFIGQRSVENTVGTPPLSTASTPAPLVINTQEVQYEKVADARAKAKGKMKEEIDMEDVDVEGAKTTLPLPLVQSSPYGQRPTLEERLKRALSPTPAPLQPSSYASVSPGGSYPTSKFPAHVFAPTPTSAPTSPNDSRNIDDRTGLMHLRPELQSRAHTFDFASHSSAHGSSIAASFDFSQPGVDIAEMDMRSALDRLVDDVSIAGGGERVNGVHSDVNQSGVTVSSGDVSMADTELITEESTELLANLQESLRDRPSRVLPPPEHLQRGSTAPIPETHFARARDSGEFVAPRRNASGDLLDVDGSPVTRRKSSRRPSARRSLSTGDADDLVSDGAAAQKRVSLLMNQNGGVLGMTFDDIEDPLTDSIERELNKIADPDKKKSYELREHEAVVYASSSQEESVSHMSQAGDLSVNKAWRAIKRTSDMNEYAREIREYRSREIPAVRIKAMSIPLPPQQTMFVCTLNNGIHFVTTPEARLTRDARIEQEFELIEHAKLEFTLSLKVRRDPHIIQQFKAITPPASVPSPAPIAGPSQRSGMRSFFGGTPRKPKHVRAQTEPIVRFVMEENLARYLKPDGTLARAFVAFKDIALHCDARLFETAFPLFGQRLEAPGEGGGAGGTMVPKQIGEIVLQVFRLPPLLGLPQNQLPQNLEECRSGLKSVHWHKQTYLEGTLTQLGGDCSIWRRRQFRVVGGSLIAFNDVTKRTTATIDLKKAISVEDDQGPDARRRDVDDFDGIYGVERSFRILFPHGQEITFFADSDEEKARWQVTIDVDLNENLTGSLF
ncbi:hypothetical protein EW145_g3090 [Phellinidium pouzarii]|uniref:PH domain-containing protein n=1 Tax=Phellinidium pouzarii TaxID=167371 RepID=A0A4S4L8V9_9AGAM|nr:hypothetical protein EW145_g3090 [Phellinidium pouzarii]